MKEYNRKITGFYLQKEALPALKNFGIAQQSNYQAITLMTHEIETRKHVRTLTSHIFTNFRLYSANSRFYAKVLYST